jgi:hypothetical protein
MLAVRTLTLLFHTGIPPCTICTHVHHFRVSVPLLITTDRANHAPQRVDRRLSCAALNLYRLSSVHLDMYPAIMNTVLLLLSLPVESDHRSVSQSCNSHASYTPWHLSAHVVTHLSNIDLAPFSY